jgi:hypothetical protein
MKTSVWRFRRQAGTDPLKPVKEPEWLMQTGIQGIAAALGGSTFRRELLLLQGTDRRIKLVTGPCHYGNGKVGEGAVPNPLGFSHETFAPPIYLGLRNGSMRDAWRPVA